MEYKLEHNMCLLCGDIHGCLRDKYEHKGFFDSVDKCGGFDNCDIVILGDIGVGFYTYDYKESDYKPYGDVKWLKELDTWAKKHNNDVWVFRGNHDDPSKYTEDSKLWDWFDNIHCLRDGDVVISKNGKRYLVIPGSISIDRCGRHRVEGFTYWSDEYIKYDLYEEMAEEKFDGVFAHSGPTPPQCRKSNFVDDWHIREKGGDFWQPDKKFPKPLKETIEEERKNIDIIIDKFKPKYWFNGHYHQDAQFEHKGVKVFALDIVRFLELDRYE